MLELLKLMPAPEKRAKGDRRGISHLARYRESCPPGCRPVIVTAFELADRWSHRLPCVEELMSEHGMSRANAYRWIASMAHARPYLRYPTEAEISAAGGTKSVRRRYVS